MASDGTIEFGVGPTTDSRASNTIEFGSRSPWTMPSIGAPTIPYEAPTWTDYGAIAGESFAHTIAGVAERAGYHDTAETWRQRARDWGDSVSPDARANYEANLGSQRWREHPFSQFALNAVSQAPQIGAIGLSEAVGGPWAAAGMGALVYGAGAADAVGEAIHNTPDEQLGPRFQELVNGGMSSQDARRQLTMETLNQSHAAEIAGILGAGVGVLGPVGQIARGPFGGAGIVNRLGRMGVSGIESGLIVGGQDLGTNLALNQAYGLAGVPQMSPEDMAWSAGKQALEMGAFGALGGMRRPLKPPARELPIEEQPAKLPWQAPQAREIPQLPPPLKRLTGPPEIPEARTATGEPIEVPPTRAYMPGGTSDQLQELEDLRKQVKGGGRQEEGVSPTADRSAEPSQTPSAPLKSAQAAPIIPDQGPVTTDEAKETQTQQRRGEPVHSENVGIRSARDKYAKPRAGRDIGPREGEQPQERGPSVPSSPVSDDQATALQAALRVPREELTIGSQALARVSDRLDQLPPDQRQQIADQLREAGRGGVADMIEGRREERGERGEREEPPAAPPEPPPVTPPPTTVPTPTRVAPTPTRVPIAEARTGRAPTSEEMRETAGEGVQIKAGHEPAWRIASRDRNNRLADEVVSQYPRHENDANALLPDRAGGKGALALLRARATAMLNRAKELGVEIPKEFKKKAEGGLDHSPSLVILDEARRFLGHIKGEFSEADRVRAVEKFLGRELDLKAGKYEDVLLSRSKEAEAAKGVRKEKAIEQAKLEEEAEKAPLRPHVRTPEEELIRKERFIAAAKKLKEIIDRGGEDSEEGKKAWKQFEELAPYLPEEYKASRKTLYQHLQDIIESEKGITTVHDARLNSSTYGQEKKATPVRSTNIHELLSKVNYNNYHVALRGLMKVVVRKLDQLAGDVPVHIFDTKEWNKFMDPHDEGKYNPYLNHIVIHQDFMETATPVHEAFHAATVYAYERFPEFKAFIDRLHKEIMVPEHANKFVNLPRSILHSPIEMLTEMMSNWEVQNAFKNIIVSPELAKDLGIKPWPAKSIFRAAIDKMRELLGLDPKYTSAMEAAAAISEKGFRLQQAILREREQTIDSWPEEYKKVNDRLKESYEDIRDRIKYEPASAMLRLKNWFETPRDWGVQLENKGHFLKSFRQWLEHMSKQGYERTQYLKKYLDVAKSIAILGYQKPQEFTKLVDLLLSAARHGAHPDDELFKGRNEFLRPTNPAHWEAIAGHPEDRAKYNALQEGTQKIFRDIRDKMQEIHKSDMVAARNSLVKNYRKYVNKQEQSFRDVFEKVAKDEELTAKENEQWGDDPYIQDIHHYNRMIGRDSGRMFYFPMKRTAWKFAITGTHDYEAPKNARSNPEDPHRFIFDNVNDAYAFTRDVGLPSYREIKSYYDVKDAKGNVKREYVSSDEVRQIGGENVKPEKEYHVVVDPEHTEFANSKTEGERIREAMAKAGIKNISGVMPAEGQAIRRYGFYGPQIEAMKNRMDKLEHLTPYERKAAQDAIEHAAIASMRGNYLPQSLLPRRRVMGTDNIDIIKAFWDRVKASANFQTMAEHRNEIDDALKAMKDEVKSKRTHADATELNSFYNMVEDRTMSFATDALDDMNMSTLMHHIQSLGIIRYLDSPAFLAYHQLHVPLVVIPNLAKHIGWFPAFRMALDTYRQMAGGMPVIGKGIKGAWERAWNYDKEPTDFVDALMQELKKHGGKDDELKAMQWAVENDIMHHTGINFSSYFKGMGAAERFEQKAMDVSHEIIGSADAVNRFNSMLMFYRAAKSMGKEGEEAFRWAGDRVAETQGQFTAFNRVGLMRNPNMRAILQFKSFPLILMKTVTKALYNSLRWGATQEERVDAIKTLAGLMGASMVLSGVQGAIPEPIEDINNILSAFGLMNTWDEYEDKLRGYVADNMGTDVATYIMNGVVGGGLGVDLTHRGGISNLTGFARLHVTKPQDLESSLFKWMAGVPGSIIGDGIDGANAMETGDIPGMMKGFLPRVITDPVKAYQLYNEGVVTRAGKVITPPLGLPDALKQALGLAPLTASLAREARYVTGEERAQQQQERTKIEKMYASGNTGYAYRAMQEYNRTYPDDILKLGDLKRAAKEAGKKKVFGYDVPSKRQQAEEMRHRAEAYGVPVQ